MKYVGQRRKKLNLLVPSRNQTGLGIPKNASPNAWTAPLGPMTGSNPPQGDSASGDVNYYRETPEVRRRYNISK